MAFKVNGWSHLIIEGYCFINNDYRQKKSKYIYTIPTNGEDVEKWSKDKFNPKNWIKEPNPKYDPTAKPDKKPEYCKGRVSIACLRDGRACPHFNFCGIEDKLKKKFSEMFKEYYSETFDV
jgi:hypothetical protein